MQTKIDPCDTQRNNLIAAALGLQQCTKTAGTETHIPGTGKRILVGDDAYLARMALPAVEKPAGDLTDEQISEIFRSIVPAGEPMPNTFKFAIAIARAAIAAHLASQPKAEPIADLTEFTERSIRDHADFRDDIERLSTADSRTRKALRKEIYDTIDARVRNAVKAALASPSPAPAGAVVPEGWQIVPKIPTPEMVANIAAFVDGHENDAEVIYRAMLAAAPAAQEAQHKAVTDLHNAIMNLPCDASPYDHDPDQRLAYKIGHRDARHAAAELVGAQEAAKEAEQGSVQAKPVAALTDKGRAVIWNDNYYQEPWVSKYRPLYLAATTTTDSTATASGSAVYDTGEHARHMRILNAERNQALEEAAQICDSEVIGIVTPDSVRWDAAAKQCAERIRALRTIPATPASAANGEKGGA